MTTEPNKEKTSKATAEETQPISEAAQSIAETHKKLEAEAEKQAQANAEAHEKTAKEAAEFQKKMDAHQAKTQAESKKQ